MPNFDSNYKDPALIQLLIVATSVTLFGFSLFQIGFYTNRPGDPASLGTGLTLLLVGMVAVVDLNFAWLANPALLLAWFGIWTRPTRTAALYLAITGFGFALSFLLYDDIPANEGGDGRLRIVRYGPGYWLWLASNGTMATGTAFVWWFTPRLAVKPLISFEEQRRRNAQKEISAIENDGGD